MATASIAVSQGLAGGRDCLEPERHEPCELRHEQRQHERA